MKPVTFFGFIFIVLFSSFVSKEIDRGEFYKAFSGKTEEDIDGMISLLEKEKSSSLILAYQGALYMKKAGFVKGVNSRVKTFKEGAHLLEEEIARKPANSEYRFLRLAVQEHAPKILGYKKNLDEDKKVVSEAYKNLEPDLKKIVKNYAANSAVIKIDDLQ